MVYTICIGSNEHRKDNLALARKRLSELFPDIRFSAEADTKPLFFRRQALFTNQVARFISDYDADEVILRLKNIEREAGRRNRRLCASISTCWPVIARCINPKIGNGTILSVDWKNYKVLTI